MVESSWASAWAKSRQDEHGQTTHWLSLHQHLDDTAAVAGRLVDLWVSPQVLARIAQDVGGLGNVKPLVIWLAAVHDVGKVSPAFACQVDTLADHMGKYGFKVHPSLKRDPSRGEINHALVGHLAVRDWLIQKLVFSSLRASQLAGIVGSHHGVTPENARISQVKNRKDSAGTAIWAKVREQVLERATFQIGGPGILARYREFDLSLPVQALLTGIVIVADWIASNDEFFPWFPISTLDDRPHELDEDQLSRITAKRLEAGWSILNFPPRWQARPLADDLDQVFRDRFNPKALGIRQIQAVTIEAAKEQKHPA